MRRTAKVILFVCLSVLLVRAPALAAPAVQPEAQVIVHIAADKCANPRPAAWDGPGLFARGEGWRLVGALGDDWEATLNLSAGDQSVAERLAGVETLAEALERGDLAAVKALQGAALHAESQLSARMTVEGVEVVAAAHAGDAGTLATLGAAEALARTCHADPAQVGVTVVPALDVAWRVIYRSGIPEGPASVRQGENLAARLRAGLRGGALVGWHRPTGGELVVYVRHGLLPPVPEDEALSEPGLHLVVQEARKGRWSHPFQAVVKFLAPDDKLALAKEKAIGVAGFAGPRCQVMAGPERTRHVVEAKERALGKLDLTPEQLDRLLNGFERPLSRGGTLHVRSHWEGELAKLVLRGAKGRKARVEKLAAVRSFTGPTALAAEKGVGAVYLSVPRDRTVPVATLVSKFPATESLRINTASWAILPEEEQLPLLDWWQGKR